MHTFSSSNQPYTTAGQPETSSLSPPGKDNYGQNAIAPDEYSQLHPLALGKSTGGVTISFPGVLFREERSNSLAIHTFPNTPGARVENMGLDPAHYHIRAVLTNHIYPGGAEKWVAGTLFPGSSTNPDSIATVFDKLRLLLTDVSDKIFVHPFDGQVIVQVVSWSYELLGDRIRDGCFVDINLIETRPLSQPTFSQSTDRFTGVAKAAAQCEVFYGSIPEINPPQLNLAGFFTQIAATVSNTLAYPSQIVNGVNNQIGKTAFALASGTNNVIGALSADSPAFIINNTIQTIINSKVVLGSTVSTASAATGNKISQTAALYEVTRSALALNTQDSANASQWFANALRFVQDAQRYYIETNNAAASPMIEALKQLQYQILQASSATAAVSSSKGIIQSTVLQASLTFPALARLLNQSLDDLLSLNQGLTDLLYVPAQSTVFYYQG